MGHEPLAKLRLNLQSESLLFCAHPLQLGGIYNHQRQYVPCNQVESNIPSEYAVSSWSVFGTLLT